jgi:hypothetical protein
LKPTDGLVRVSHADPCVVPAGSSPPAFRGAKRPFWLPEARRTGSRVATPILTETLSRQAGCGVRSSPHSGIRDVANDAMAEPFARSPARRTATGLPIALDVEAPFRTSAEI